MEQTSFESMDPEPLGSGKRRLGKSPAKSDMRMLHFANFAEPEIEIPEETTFWKERKQFELRTFGNNDHGCCPSGRSHP